MSWAEFRIHDCFELATPSFSGYIKLTCLLISQVGYLIGRDFYRFLRVHDVDVVDIIIYKLVIIYSSIP